MAFGALLGTLSGSGVSVTNPSVASGSVTVSVGDLIVGVMCEQTNLTVTAVTDNLGNTYTAQNAGTDAGNDTGRMFYSRVTAAGTLTTLNFAATASTDNFTVVGAAYAGPFTTPPIDANPANVSNSLTSPFTGPATGTLSQASELIVAWAAAGILTATDWVGVSVTKNIQTTDGAVTNAVIASAVVSSTASVTPSFTGTAPSAADVLGTASFKAAVAAVGKTLSRLLLPPQRGMVGWRGLQKLQAFPTTVIAPFAQQDWPNPVQPPRIDHTWTWSFPLNLIGQDVLPFRQQDWPIPRGSEPDPRRSWTWGYSLSLIGQDVLPFRQQDWPVPPRLVWYRDWSQNLVLTTLAATQAQPFNQYDWPNPQARQPVRTDQPPNLLLTMLATTQARPFVQQDWPVPRGAEPDWRRSWSWSFPPNLIGQDQLPFRQQDWPIPRGYEPDPRRSWTWSYSLNLIGKDALPFRQQSWPLPVPPPRPDATWLQGFSPVLTPVVVLYPHNQFDWPNPPLPPRLDQTWTWRQIRMLGQDKLPFRQQDWPNPARTSRIDATWLQGFSQLLTTIVTIPPHNQYDWPLPTPRPRLDQFWAWRQVGMLGLDKLPFRQQDWPNPIQTSWRPAATFPETVRYAIPSGPSIVYAVTLMGTYGASVAVGAHGASTAVGALDAITAVTAPGASTVMGASTSKTVVQ